MILNGTYLFPGPGAPSAWHYLPGTKRLETDSLSGNLSHDRLGYTGVILPLCILYQPLHSNLKSVTQ